MKYSLLASIIRKRVAYKYGNMIFKAFVIRGDNWPRERRRRENRMNEKGRNDK